MACDAMKTIRETSRECIAGMCIKTPGHGGKAYDITKEINDDNCFLPMRSIRYNPTK